MSAIASLPDFQRLMSLAANRVGRLLNQSELARDAAIPQPTVYRHLNLLETGFLLARVAPFASNPATGLVKSRKLYWTDCGLAAWLANVRSARDLQNRGDQGFWLEQTLFQSFQAWRALDPAKRRIWYWRDRSGHEVDFVLERNGILVAVEIKAGGQVAPGDAAGIMAFRESLGKNARFQRGIVLYAGAPRMLADRVLALPWGWLVPRRNNVEIMGSGLAFCLLLGIWQAKGKT
jgi:predicted AAA+ superfamily ATPase